MESLRVAIRLAHLARLFRSSSAGLLKYTAASYSARWAEDVSTGEDARTEPEFISQVLSVDSGLSVNTNSSGRIFVTGRRLSDDKPLTSDVLFGILNFIWDAMDLYAEGEPVWPYLKRWAEEYKGGTWEPGGGCGCVDVFNTDIERVRPNKKVVHGP